MLKRILALLIATVLLVSCSQPAPSSVASSSQSEISLATPSSSAVIDNPSTPGLPDSALAVPEPSSTASSSPSSAVSDFASKTWWQKGLAPESFVCMAVADNPDAGYCYDTTADKLVLTENGRISERVSYRLYDDTAKLSKGCYSMFNKPDNSDLHNLGYLTDTAQEVESIGARILPNSFFELVANDDTKYTGEFFEQGIKLTQALPDKDKGRSVNLAIGDADYRFILDKAEEILANDKSRAAAWLTMMRYSRLVTAQVSYDADKATYERNEKGELPWQADYLFSTLQGSVSSSATATALTTLPDAAVVILEFNNSLIYTIHVSNKQMLVTASGIESSLLYELGEQSSMLRGLIAHAKGQINPET